MAVNLKDISVALAKQSQEQNQKTSKEVWSIGQLREYLATGIEASAQQKDLLQTSEKTQQQVLESMTVSVEQEKLALQNADENTDKIVSALAAVKESVSDVAESFTEIKKSLSGRQVSDVMGKAGDQPEFTTIGERFGNWKQNTFSVRGAAKNLFGVKQGGVIDTMLAKREEKNQAISDYMKVTGKNREEGEVEFSKFQDLMRQKRNVERSFNRIKKTYGEEAALATPEGQKYQQIAGDLSSLQMYGLGNVIDKQENAKQKSISQPLIDAEAKQEQTLSENIIAGKEASIEQQQLETQNKMLESLQKIYETLGNLKNDDDGGGLGLSNLPMVGGLLGKSKGALGSVSKLVGGGLGKIGGLARAGLGAVSMGSVAAIGAGVGGALLAGYAGKKLREHIQQKEANNRAAEQQEISTTKLDVDQLKKLPDAGSAWKPSDVSAVSRLTNLTEQRIEAQQSFTPEEAVLVKQKLDLIVPKDLIGKAEEVTPNTTTKSESSVPTTSAIIDKPKEVGGSGVKQILAPPPSTTSVSSPATANVVYGASADNASASMITSAGTTNNVVAPTTINNTTTQANNYKPDVRNQDSSFKRMLDSRYVPV